MSKGHLKTDDGAFHNHVCNQMLWGKQPNKTKKKQTNKQTKQNKTDNNNVTLGHLKGKLNSCDFIFIVFIRPKLHTFTTFCKNALFIR